MHAVVLHAPNDLRFEVVPTPEPRPGEILVRVRSAAVCGTDLRIVDGSKTRGVRYPSILGHELAGDVAAIGEGVAGVAVGERVCVTPIVYCLKCHYCLHGLENMCVQNRALGYDFDGGFAEYALVPAQAVAAGNVYKLPDRASYDEGALAEPLACCVNGQEKSRVSMGQSVLVAGAGPIGLMHVQLARVAGAREVIVAEPQAHRREVARQMGATVAVDPGDGSLSGVVAERTGGLGVDAAIMAIGAAGIVDATLSLVRKGGTFNLFAGFPGRGEASFSANLVHYGEITVVGTSSSSRRHYETALALIAAGAVDLGALVTGVYPLERTVEAIADVRRGEGLRAVIHPNGEVVT
jgi:L-iditol 2-dehydrogenase